MHELSEDIHSFTMPFNDILESISKYNTTIQESTLTIYAAINSAQEFMKDAKTNFNTITSQYDLLLEQNNASIQNFIDKLAKFFEEYQLRMSEATSNVIHQFDQTFAEYAETLASAIHTLNEEIASNVENSESIKKFLQSSADESNTFYEKATNQFELLSKYIKNIAILEKKLIDWINTGTAPQISVTYEKKSENKNDTTSQTMRNNDKIPHQQ